MGPGAIHNKKSVTAKLGHTLSSDQFRWYVDGSRNMCLSKGVRATYVHQDVVDLASLVGVKNVRAIRLKAQTVVEVCVGLGWSRCRNLADKGGHRVCLSDRARAHFSQGAEDATVAKSTSTGSFSPMQNVSNLVAVLAYDGLCLFEFGIAVEVFGLPRPEFDFPWYRHAIVAVDKGPMRAFEGFEVKADADLSVLPDAGTIVIPGWRSRSEPPPEALLEALRDAHERGTRLISICSGVFVLAAAGLLDGKRATTHWRYTDELANKFPAVEVDPSVLYVDAGQVITSAGSAAGIDACLHLVERDFGANIANSVARRLVMAPQRSEIGRASCRERV